MSLLQLFKVYHMFIESDGGICYLFHFLQLTFFTCHLPFECYNLAMRKLISSTLIASYLSLALVSPLLADKASSVPDPATKKTQFVKKKTGQRAITGDIPSLDPQPIVRSLLKTMSPYTGLIPSHYGHPGYEGLSFLYDISVSALVLYAAGYQKESEAILDYFAKRLDVPIKDIESSADTNGIFGIMKVMQYGGPGSPKTRALVNAIDINSVTSQGKGLLEFYTTPGPMAFLIFALLQVNTEKYRKYALELGDAVLSMQDKEGGIRDGDRARDRVHTEPNMDCMAAFSMLYQVSGDRKWADAADKAFNWFMKHVYEQGEGSIYQGIWEDRPSKLFATDVYSWTMAGPAGDRLSADELKRLTQKMLDNCMAKITLELPDGSVRTAILADFANAEDSRVMNARQGFHPMGTIEWTGGVVLALQKNAVRLWKEGDRKTAIEYKAMAQLLLKEAGRCFYSIDDPQSLTTFYATAQGVEIAPFGAIQNKSTTGWTTTYYYVKRADGTALVKGGASIGAWILLPYLGFNPFVLHDAYKNSYDAIPVTGKQMVDAMRNLGDISAGRTFTETVPSAAPDRRTQIVEPRIFNKKMWEEIEYAYKAKSAGDVAGMRRSFERAMEWAMKVLQNPVWVELAKSDNAIKKREVGGLIFYPWGMVIPNNEHSVHFAIQRYPLLNEVGTAAWGMATGLYESGRPQEAKKWIERIVDDFPLHQIAAVQAEGSENIIGYWNALVSWEDKSLGPKHNPGIYRVYEEILSERHLASAKPPVVFPAVQEKEKRPDMSPLPAAPETENTPNENTPN